MEITCTFLARIFPETVTYQLTRFMPIAESTCVGCAQCAAVCPTGAIVVKNDSDKVWQALDNKEIKVTVQIAPAVRVALGQEFGLPDGENAMGSIVAALRRMGFDEIYDTSTGADLTVLEESNELIKRLASEDSGEKHAMPLFTSCCPSWVNFCEKLHPELLQDISTCRSPMQMFAALLKEQGKTSRRQHVQVAVMPCTAKKFEAAREEFKDNGDHVASLAEWGRRAVWRARARRCYDADGSFSGLLLRRTSRAKPLKSG